MAKHAAIGGLICGLMSASAWAGSPKVAVADFDFSDTSGEPKDQSAAHTARLKELHQVVSDALTETKHFLPTDITCPSPPCTADTLDAASLTDQAKKTGATLLVFGGVHKISTLITFGRIEVVDLATGKSVLNKTITFRGDSEDAWRHADAYIADMVVTAANGRAK